VSVIGWRGQADQISAVLGRKECNKVIARVLLPDIYTEVTGVTLDEIASDGGKLLIEGV